MVSRAHRLISTIAAVTLVAGALVGGLPVLSETPAALAVADPTTQTPSSVKTKAAQVLDPSNQKFDSYNVADVYFSAPANINATEIMIKRTGANNLYLPPTDFFNFDTPNVKVAEFERMYHPEYQVTWDDIRRADMQVSQVERNVVKLTIAGGMKMEKGEYVKLTNAFAFNIFKPIAATLEITVTGAVQAGGFCEDRARYTFPARPLHKNVPSRVKTVIQDDMGQLVDRDNKIFVYPEKSLKEISLSNGIDDPYRVFFAPWHKEYATATYLTEDKFLKEYVVRHIPYHNPQGQFVDSSQVVQRQGKRELTTEERKNGVNVYVNESVSNAQIRWKSYVARQNNGTGIFTRLGGPAAETGWVINALAFNPLDNWLYGISQGRLGEDWGRRPNQTIQSDENIFRDVLTGEDPCFPAGHLLQINPVTGDVFNLGRVTSTNDQFKTGYGFQGVKETHWPNDLWGGINVGGIDKDGNYYVANASLSGSGALYKVNLGDVTASLMPGADKWLTSMRGRGDWGQTADHAGRAWAEDLTPLFVPEKTDCMAAPGKPCKQQQAGNYMWGISNGWNSLGANATSQQYRLYIERTNLANGAIQRWDITDKRTYAGQQLPLNNQWGRAWSYGNNLLGFATSSSGANDKVATIKVTNPESDTPTFELVSVNAKAKASYNSNGTSAVNFEENVVDLKMNKTRKDYSDKDGQQLVRWDLDVTNTSKDANSSGFNIFDAIPKTYKIVRLEAASQTVNAIDGTQIVGPWSVYLKQGDGNRPDVVEGIHGTLEAGRTATLTVIATSRTGDAPAECMENVAGVIGFDRDPSSVTASEFEKTVEGRVEQYGDWIGRNGGTFADLVSDHQCRPTVVVKKQLIEDNKIIDPAADGWTFTAKSSKENLDIEGQTTYANESTKTTAPSGTENGTISWRPKDGGPFKLEIREEMSKEQTEAGYVIHRQGEGEDLHNASCKLTVKDGKRLQEPLKINVTDVKDSPSFSFNFGDETTFPGGMNIQTEQRIECVVQNEVPSHHIYLRKEAYDPHNADHIGTLEDLTGAEFAVYELAGNIPTEVQPTSWEEWQKYIAKNADGSLAQPTQVKGYQTQIPVKIGKSYIVVETKAPKGQDGRQYSLRPAPIPFTVTEPQGEDAKKQRPLSIHMDNKLMAHADWKNTANAEEHAQMYLTVADVHTGTLPHTGGIGVAWLGAIGTFIILTGMWCAKRRVA